MRTLLLLCCICTAQILYAQQDYFIKFPDDLIQVNCTAPIFDYGQPLVSNSNGGAVSISYTDQMITVVPDGCFIVMRDWYVFSNPYDPQQGCINVPNPSPSAVANHPSNLPGPIVAPAGTAAPWAPTVVKVTPSDPAPTDYSIFWSASANCYRYTQRIKIIDTENPVFVNCPASPVTIDDPTPNDPELWNESYWAAPFSSNPDRSEAPAGLQLTVTDFCYGDNVSAKYELFLDLNGDGFWETVIRSDIPPAAGTVNYNNINNPNYNGGTPRDFDERLVSPGEKYRFGLYSVADSLFQRHFYVGWHTDQAPTVWMPAQLPPGTHRIKWLVADQCGNENVCDYSFTVQPSSSIVRALLGKVVIDTDTNCLVDTNETGLHGWLARLEHLDSTGLPDAEQYKTANAYGGYHFFVDTGSYHLSLQPPNGYWYSCPPDLDLDVQSVGDSSYADFSLQPQVLCPFLETDISTWGLRRCFDNTYTVRYCNTGTASAADAYLRITIDPFMEFVSAGIPGTAEGNHTWRFDLGAIPIGECGSFPLVLHLSCDGTVLGQSHCVEAHIYPDSFCLPLPGWSGATVEVEGSCAADSVKFLIRNTGTGPSSLLDYIVIEDNIINFQGMFQLPAGDSLPVAVLANGSTWRMETEQEPGSPGEPIPSATVEACGQNGSGGFSIHYLPQFGEADGNPYVSIDCQQSRGSFDPNDKLASPQGYGPEHLIRPDQPLEYHIRFQNTGTDTAFRVVVLDTLAAWLDPATVITGASSHPYRFELSGKGVLNFTFDNILLLDSNVNEAASHGFVKFRVRQRPFTPFGTFILNQAAIYFDFNEPVYTAEVFHRVGIRYLPTDVAEKPGAVPIIRVLPNPVSRSGILQFENLQVTGGRFTLFDAQGRMRLQQSFTGINVALNAAELSPGLYYFHVFEGMEMTGVGKVVLY
ncbi:MAG: T9SS type A sorting domain-containing protein [Saprospiraceae bacterium]|nr:T9SS type A sorting domain-containing protein [Saprospiraceae bacterium]